MNWRQIAENWNGQVAKLYDWTIKRLACVADKSDVKTTQTDHPPASVTPRNHTGREESYEIQH